MLSMVIVVVLRIGSFGVTRRNGQVSLSEFSALGKRPLNHWEYAGERSHCSVEEYKILRRSLGEESRRSCRVTITLKGPAIESKTAAGKMEYAWRYRHGC